MAVRLTELDKAMQKKLGWQSNILILKLASVISAVLTQYYLVAAFPLDTELSKHSSACLSYRRS